MEIRCEKSHNHNFLSYKKYSMFISPKTLLSAKWIKTHLYLYIHVHICLELMPFLLMTLPIFFNKYFRFLLRQTLYLPHTEPLKKTRDRFVSSHVN